MAFFCIHCKSEIDPKYKACPYCGDPITDFLRRYAETPLDGKYQILDRLGVGGMGEVYKVLHTHLNSIRVIKLMRSNIAADAGAHERFLREARLATKIQHPNVATLFDYSTLDDGSNYMVWEYIEGINLHELIDQRGPLSPRYAARLSVQALMGLDAIHRAGIVHRDVSPENLMITRDDHGYVAPDGSDTGHERVKIIDLGIAKQSSSEDNKTKTGMFVGKWKYCSPEHLGMLPAGERIDGRADLYSFGIVLYEMLTGVPPFQADTPHAYLMMHASSSPRPMRDVNPGIVDVPQLEALILRALEKDRSKRFASAREFAQELERIAKTLPDMPGAPPPVPASAELTDEATRQARVAQDAATVMSVAGNAPTVATTAPAVHKTLDRGPEVGGATAASAVGNLDGPFGSAQGRLRGRRSTWLYVAAVVLALVAAGGWMLTRERPRPAATNPLQSSLEAKIAVPAAQGHVGINAFPWAQVTSVKNVDNGQSIDIGANVVTPTPLDLAPGRYEVTLSNPNFARPITRTISVAPGMDETLWVSFSDPASAAVPDFGVAP